MGPRAKVENAAAMRQDNKGADCRVSTINNKTDAKPAWFYKHHVPAILNNISDKIPVLGKRFFGLHYKQSVSLPLSLDNVRKVHVSP